MAPTSRTYHSTGVSSSMANGTAPVNYDDAELEASGYRREMPRQFSTFSLLALAYALILAIGNGLKQGSSSGSIFMLFPAALFIGVVSLGMAELTSAFPVAGGQYYWAFILSPSKFAPFICYATAIISVLGIWLGGAATCNFISGMILSIVQFVQPEYAIHPWHKYLVYVAIILAGAMINIFGARKLPAFNRFICVWYSSSFRSPSFRYPLHIWLFSSFRLITDISVIFSMFTFVVTISCMLFFSYPHYNSVKWVFTDTTISSGWSNHPLAWTLCFVNNLYGFLGTDAGVHMTEEIPNPSVTGPKVIMYPVLIGLVTAFPFACVCMFVIKDINEILNAPSGLPLIQLYYQATGSHSITVVLMAMFVFCFFACAVANITGSSRSLWSAARDECFPRSDLWKKINPVFGMPLNAVFLQVSFAIIYGLVFLGSEAAFELMVSASVIFLVGSYVIPQTVLLFVDRSNILPERPFNLGRYGYAVNLISTVWTALLIVACCIPTEYPVTHSNMNYNSIVASTLFLFTWLGWVCSRRAHFHGPNVDKSMLTSTRQRHLHGQEPDEDVDERSPLL